MTTGLNEPVRDPDEALERITSWAAGLSEKAERYSAAREDIERMRLSSTSADGTVKATVGSDGVLTDLEFGSRTRSIPPEELARLVLSTMRSAQSRITQQMGDVMSEHLGDEDPESRAVLLDAFGNRFPEQNPDEPLEDDDEHMVGRFDDEHDEDRA